MDDVFGSPEKRWHVAPAAGSKGPRGIVVIVVLAVCAGLMVAVATVVGASFWFFGRSDDRYDGLEVMHPTAPPAEGSVPAGMYARPSGTTTVDVATVEEVVAAAWPVREYAILHDELDYLAVIETGAAREIDTGCRCPGRPFESRRGVLWSYLAPAENPYPAWFVAEIRDPSRFSADSLFMIFVRSGPDEPWLIEFVDEAPFRVPVLPAGDPAMLASSSLSASRAQAHPQYLAIYLNTWIETGEGSGGPYDTIGVGEIGRDTWNQKRELEQAGGSFAAHFEVAEPVRALGLPDGEEFVCATIRGRTVRNSPPGLDLLVQPADRSQFGPQLEPGSYVSIERRSARQFCWVDRHGAPGGDWIIGGRGGVVATVGTPDR
jgi:hypothetical protein